MPQTLKKEKASNPDAFKHLFGKPLLKRMAEAISDVFPAFEEKKFLALIVDLQALEMKPRVRAVRDELRRQLPKDYPKALRILLRSTENEKLRGFDLWPYTEFIQTYGLEDVKISLEALKELTPLFTSEFAVRPFLQSHPNETLKFLLECAKDENSHVRRWASEGSRPRLPWGERLQGFVRDPSPTLPILERLKYDPELYVRKSVSNHLNDIAKDHPQKVIKLLGKWKKSTELEHAAKMDWIIRRSLRTLVKMGDPGALALIGVSPAAKTEVTGFKLNKDLFAMGEPLEFQFKLRSLSAKPQKIVIDYIIHFVKSNRLTSAKVFKLKTVVLAAHENIVIAKAHPLKKITTRVHYSGDHFLEIQVNGKIVHRKKWRLAV